MHSILENAGTPVRIRSAHTNDNHSQNIKKEIEFTSERTIVVGKNCELIVKDKHGYSYKRQS